MHPRSLAERNEAARASIAKSIDGIAKLLDSDPLEVEQNRDPQIAAMFEIEGIAAALKSALKQVCSREKEHADQVETLEKQLAGKSNT